MTTRGKARQGLGDSLDTVLLQSGRVLSLLEKENGGPKDSRSKAEEA